MSLTLQLLIPSLVAIPCFAVLFFIARKLDNYGVVDVAWALSFAPLAAFHVWQSPLHTTRGLCLLLLAVLWSLRLGIHLGRRVFKNLRQEDGRYQRLRAQWKPHFGRTMFGFFLLQGQSVVLLGLPFLLAASDPRPKLDWLDLMALSLGVLALLGETLSDRQLARFKARPTSKGRICEEGLWSWSRHPNYFFESLVWCAFALLGLGAPQGWSGLLSPVLITLLLLKVTGIRYTEEQLLASKGPAYVAYREKTSAFIPLPPFLRLRHQPQRH